MIKISRRNWLIGGAALAGVAMTRNEITNAANREPGLKSTINKSTLELIGNTPLLELRNIVPKDHARILIKVEAENPTGSMKDRMALAMIEAAEKDGRLKKGGSVVEYTGGSTGVALSFICSVKGYPIDIVTSDAFSSEKLNHMKALGANLTVIKSKFGGMDEALTRDMIETARIIQQDKGGYWTNQLSNEDQLISYRKMGKEIWQQSGGQVDAFVQGVGTGGSLRGNAEILRKYNSNIHVVAVEPSESAVLSGESESSHKIEGIGAGFIVPLWKPELVTDIEKVSTEDAMAMARRLAREEGLFAGTSTGSNLIAALKKAKELGPKSTVVTLMVDTGMKYLSTALYGAPDK
jgi:cysteine synthase